jgi:hypothetical protein
MRLGDGKLSTDLGNAILIESKAEVGQNNERFYPQRFHQKPPGQSAPGICPFADVVGATLQFPGGHAKRTKDHILAIVQRPITRQDPPLLFQSIEDWSPRERCVNANLWQIESRVHDVIGSFLKNRTIIRIKSKNKTGLDENAVVMESVHHLRVGFAQIPDLAR